MPNLPILHWNDVYRVGPQKINKTDTIDVTQFAALLEDLKAQWPVRNEDGTSDGLVLFSGDVFSPSVESSVTRGSHMVPVMNNLAPDVSLTGNHDFDFGYPHLTKLIGSTTFPWILSNIIDSTTGRVPETIHEFRVIEKAGIRIGIVGLVEKEWIATISSWPPQFEYRDMTEIGLELSQRLRDPDGEYKCDIVLALSHARIPNDIVLARSLNAFSPSTQEKTPVCDLHGVDLVLGGHDHEYYVSKGVSEWKNYDLNKEVLGSAGDRGDILVVKSGTDFRDLTEVNLELEQTPEGSVRKYIVKRITGVRHAVRPDYRSSEAMAAIVNSLLSSVGKTMKAPVCFTKSVLDCRSKIMRTSESAAANWFADVLRHAYDDALCLKGCGGADGVIICAGTLRGDSEYGPGVVTIGNIMEILPFGDPIVVLELDGAAIWGSLEASLSKWPAQEGRFPVVSGLRVLWNSSKPPGERVQGIWLLDGDAPDGRGEPVKNTTEGRKYKIVTREYLAQGNDGFTALKDHPYLIDDESGQPMSTIVRKYLLGSHFVKKMARLADSNTGLLNPHTQSIISRAQEEKTTGAAERWRRGASLAVKWAKSRAQVQNNLLVCGTEHMSSVDPFDGEGARKGNPAELVLDDEPDQDLLVIDPEVDDRLKDNAAE
ncbi:hypothetical protein AX16_008684 [Volvariella volvacea WC 439]|nr:hypothetical protein AX16_008684 [Volvariella volvacea WC 439]